MRDRLRIVQIGRSGQVARALSEASAWRDDVTSVALGRPEIDLEQPTGITAMLGALRPDIVVNCAAYTAVDRAESEPGLAFALNRDGAAAIAMAAAELGVPLLHLSTDYVYDGTKIGPYVEEDPVAPLNVYGRSKHEGEMAVAAANPSHLILRTSWVHAPHGHNFVRTMLRLAAREPRLRVVDDQIGQPTYAPDLAEAVIAIALDWRRSGFDRASGGIYHIAGPDRMSWHAFASAIMAASAARGGPSVPIDAIATEDYPTPARRPRNSTLDTAKLAGRFGVTLPTTADALARSVPLILRGAPAPGTCQERAS